MSITDGPAAFRRLCVETLAIDAFNALVPPAAFRRLCVETAFTYIKGFTATPAAFRRLCVETAKGGSLSKLPDSSRLQAAVC